MNPKKKNSKLTYEIMWSMSEKTNINLNYDKIT